MMRSPEQLHALSETAKNKSFDSFIAMPSVRLLISMIPASEHAEVLTTLLKEAYFTGWGGGSAATLSIMLAEMIKGQSPR
jgi:hypothetical protein